VSRQRVAGALVVLALLLGAGGGSVWLATRDDGPAVDADLTAFEHAGRACDSFAAALAGIRRDAPARRVFADLDRADREARAAVNADPVYVQLASSILLGRQLIKDDSADGLGDALDRVNAHCNALVEQPSPGPSTTTRS
jgi:hypothetical protein